MPSRTAPTQPTLQRSALHPYTLPLSRRQLLKVLGASACTATLGGLLAACSDASGSAPGLDVPVGSFTAARVSVPCGLAGGGGVIGSADDPASFSGAGRSRAQVLWFATGFVEYTVPVPPLAFAALEVSAELCSEANLHNSDYPSDITLWLNGTAVGSWTSPGDFGDRPGRLTPGWWDPRFSQYGRLKTWRVDAAGSFLDGAQVSEVTLAELALEQNFSLRLGVAEDARNVGGLNLFGEGFGDYGQGIGVTYAPS